MINSNQPNTNDKKVISFGLSVVVIVFFIIGGWMATAPLSSASVAVGQVSAGLEKKVVQHLEGGIIERIYVKDGDIVKKDDILIFVQSKKADVLKRLKKRKNFNLKLFKRFKKIQLPLEYKRRKSTHIIKNNFTENSVRVGIKNILKKIL